MSSHALVTGASAGIGTAFARSLAASGWDLVLVARNRERLEELARSLSGEHRVQVEVCAADLSGDSGVAATEEKIRNLPALDLLVNNAGFGTYGQFADLPAEQEAAEIRLNVLALARLTRAALPGMISRGRGSIINVSSIAGFQAAPFNATYGATKAFVTSFTEALSEEVRGTGVRVQALCPGLTRTEFQDRAGIDISSVPAFASMSAEEVVDSSLAALETGQVVHIPGVTNRILSGVTSLVPRAIARRLAGVALAGFGREDPSSEEQS